MTIGITWVGTRRDGRKHLYIATDSRTRGAMVLDCSPKILTLPRSDCAICFAGNTAATYPLMMQLATAIASHQPARERSLDIQTLKHHVLKVFTGIIADINDIADPITPSDVQFIFAGYSWLAKSFKIWTIYYSQNARTFAARPAAGFHPLLGEIAFVGDKSKEARSLLVRKLNDYEQHGLPAQVEYEPFRILRDMLRAAQPHESIGGPPQLVKIGEHMNTRVLAIKWNGNVTLMGRNLFDYENVDNWILDPDTLSTTRPRSFGYREDQDSGA